MNHIDTEWMPPDIREDSVSIFIESEYCFQDAKSRKDMRKAISYEVDTEPWNEWIIIGWEVERRWISEWYEEHWLRVRRPYIWEDGQYESEGERIPPEYEEDWREQCREGEEVDNPPRDPFLREKNIRHKRYTESQESKEECSPKCPSPYISPWTTIWAEIEWYTSKCYEEYCNSLPEVPPEYLREVQNIYPEERDEHIIGMKKYHPYDGNSSQSIDVSESMIHVG